MQSEQINELAAALVKAQSEYPAISKNKVVQVKNDAGKKLYDFRYADLASIIAGTAKARKDNGLAISQMPAIRDTTTVLRTCLMHSSGQYITSEFPLPIGNMKPQAIGSLITYMRRYAYTAILGICTDDDEDGNLAQGNDAVVQDRNVPAVITAAQKQQLVDIMRSIQEVAEDFRSDRLLTYYGIEFLDDLPADKFENAKTVLNAKLAKARAEQKEAA